MLNKQNAKNAPQHVYNVPVHQQTAHPVVSSTEKHTTSTTLTYQTYQVEAYAFWTAQDHIINNNKTTHASNALLAVQLVKINLTTVHLVGMTVETVISYNLKVRKNAC